jgi:hypothetical protein
MLLHVPGGLILLSAKDGVISGPRGFPDEKSLKYEYVKNGMVVKTYDDRWWRVKAGFAWASPGGREKEGSLLLYHPDHDGLLVAEPECTACS